MPKFPLLTLQTISLTWFWTLLLEVGGQLRYQLGQRNTSSIPNWDFQLYNVGATIVDTDVKMWYTKINGRTGVWETQNTDII